MIAFIKFFERLAMKLNLLNPLVNSFRNRKRRWRGFTHYYWVFRSSRYWHSLRSFIGSFFRVVFLVAVMLAICLGAWMYYDQVIKDYLYLRQDSFWGRRTAIVDSRTMGLVAEAEKIIKLDRPIEGYYDVTRLPMISIGPMSGSLEAFYTAHGVWPLEVKEQIIISEGMTKRLNDKQLLFIICHELGHAKSNCNRIGDGLLWAHERALNRGIVNLTKSVDEKLLLHLANRYETRSLEDEIIADDYGIECTDPKTALEVMNIGLGQLYIQQEFHGFNRMLRRKQRVMRKYEVYK